MANPAIETLSTVPGSGPGHSSTHREMDEHADLITEDQAAELHTVRGNSSLLHRIEFDWPDEVLKPRGSIATVWTPPSPPKRLTKLSFVG